MSKVRCSGHRRYARSRLGSLLGGHPEQIGEEDMGHQWRLRQSRAEEDDEIEQTGEEAEEKRRNAKGNRLKTERGGLFNAI